MGREVWSLKNFRDLCHRGSRWTYKNFEVSLVERRCRKFTDPEERQKGVGLRKISGFEGEKYCLRKFEN
jgi:hypothetical protein